MEKLDLTQTTPLTSITFKEVIDWKTLIKMLLDDTILQIQNVEKKKTHEFIEIENERHQMEDILRKGMIVKKHLTKPIDKYLLQIYYNHTDKYLRPFISVKYYYDKKKELGRVYPEKSLSLCSMRRKLRHHLSKDTYLDVDMVCAHPTILNQVFQGKYETLNNYVNNRTFYFQKLCDAFTIPNYYTQLDWKKPEDYEKCKELFNRLLYYGKFNTWCRDYELKQPFTEPPEFITKLVAELEEMATIIQKENPQLVEMIEKKEKKNSFENPKGTIVSWFLQEYERRILEKMIEFLKKNKKILKNNAVLCFDGIQILDDGKNNDLLIKELETYILKTTGFNMKFKIKPFDELEYTDILDKMEIPEIEDDDKYRLVEDEKEGANILYEELEHRLKFCNNQLFFKNDNLWTASEKTTHASLMDFVMSSNIKTTDAKGNVKAYAQNYNCAEHIVKAIINMAIQTPDDAFYQKFHTSTKGKLCFQDGVLDIVNNQFYLWDCEYLKLNPVYSTLLINRPFANEWNNKNEEAITRVETEVFDTIFDGQKDKVLHFLSRAFAGHIEDKDWAVFIGNRNCGKGALDTLIRNSVEGYTLTTSAQNFIAERINESGDSAKKMSWVLDLQFVRLATTQEIKIDNLNKNVKINGVMIKKIASGGDPIEARKNYLDECRFTIDTKLMIMCNDLPPVEPIDTLETCVEFKTGKQFKSSLWIAERTEELKELVSNGEDPNILLELQKYKVGDDTIKLKCAKVEWSNAFIHLLIKYYKSEKILIQNETEDGSETLTTKILKNFKITKNYIDAEHRISLKNLKKYHANLGFVDSYKKFVIELKELGCIDYKIGNERGVKGLQTIQIEVPENC